jgi:hypothetical protein
MTSDDPTLPARPKPTGQRVDAHGRAAPAELR